MTTKLDNNYDNDNLLLTYQLIIDKIQLFNLYDKLNKNDTISLQDIINYNYKIYQFNINNDKNIIYIVDEFLNSNITNELYDFLNKIKNTNNNNNNNYSMISYLNDITKDQLLNDIKNCKNNSNE